jgi:hypothetical protein
MLTPRTIAATGLSNMPIPIAPITRIASSVSQKAIQRKFFEDALVELGYLTDDNYLHVLGASDDFGGVEKDNPRIEITITEFPDESKKS